MTVSELIIELARVEDQNAKIVFYYNDLDGTECAFNVVGQAKPDAEEVQWIKDELKNVAVFVLS